MRLASTMRGNERSDAAVRIFARRIDRRPDNIRPGSSERRRAWLYIAHRRPCTPREFDRIDNSREIPWLLRMIIAPELGEFRNIAKEQLDRDCRKSCGLSAMQRRKVFAGCPHGKKKRVTPGARGRPFREPVSARLMASRSVDFQLRCRLQECSGRHGIQYCNVQVIYNF